MARDATTAATAAAMAVHASAILMVGAYARTVTADRLAVAPSVFTMAHARRCVGARRRGRVVAAGVPLPHRRGDVRRLARARRRRRVRAGLRRRGGAAVGGVAARAGGRLVAAAHARARRARAPRGHGGAAVRLERSAVLRGHRPRDGALPRLAGDAAVADA